MEEGDDSIATNSEVDRDNWFGKYSPIATIFLFSIGPAATILQSVTDTIETLEITTRYKSEEGQYAMSVVGFTPVILMFTNYFGAYLGQSVLAKVSRLIGEGRRDTAHQVVADIIRICMAVTTVFACTFVFAIKPFLKFMSCPDDLLDASFYYSMFYIVCTPIVAGSYVCRLMIQGFGHPLMKFLVRLTISVLQVGCMTPLLLWGFNASISYCKIPQISAELISIIISVIVIVKWKRDMAFPLANFCKRPVKSSFHAMFLALPTLVGIVAVIPPTLLVKTMVNVDPDNAHKISAGLGVWDKIGQIGETIIGTFYLGFLSPGTHSIGARKYRRFLKLFGWSLLFIMVPIILLSLLMVIYPDALGGLFLDKSDLEYAREIFRIPFIAFPARGISGMGTMALVALGRPTLPTVLSVVNGAVVVAGCFVLKSRVGTDAYKIMWVHPLCDVINGVIYAVALIIMFIPLYKKGDDESESDMLTSDSGLRRAMAGSTLGDRLLSDN